MKILLIALILSGCSAQQRFAMQEEMNARAQQPNEVADQMFRLQQQYAEQAAIQLPGQPHVVCTIDWQRCWRVQ